MSYLTTKTGDKGTTSLGKNRYAKNSPEIVAMAMFDICEPLISEAGFRSNNHEVKKFCCFVTRQMYEIKGLFHYNEGNISIEQMEPYIEKLENFSKNLQVPVVNFFIRPHPKNTYLMLAGKFVRSAETSIANLEGSEGLKIYVNRLSDCLHALSLHVLSKRELKESNVKNEKIIYKRPNMFTILVLLFQVIVLFYMLRK